MTRIVRHFFKGLNPETTKKRGFVNLDFGQFSTQTEIPVIPLFNKEKDTIELHDVKLRINCLRSLFSTL